MLRTLASSLRLFVLATLVACGPPATAAGTEILLAEVEEDLPAESRRALVGILRAEPVAISFPDGEGTVEVEVMSARMAVHLRSITVRVVDSAGSEMTAALVGSSSNAGTVEQPTHTRYLQVTRTRGGLGGTTLAQMSIRVQPSGVERL